MVGQVNGEFEARDERMQGYLVRVKQVRVNCKSFILKQISRGQNFYVDSLVVGNVSGVKFASGRYC